MSEPTDQELLRRYAQHGDECAFATLGRRYQRLVYSVCLRELGHSNGPDIAADAAQETFLFLARNAHHLSRPRQETLAGWLFATARNAARNARRSEGRRKRREETVGMEWENARDQEAQKVWEQLEPCLNDQLASLRPVDRETLLLRFFEQRSLAEIGQCLGIGENAAQMRVSRALERLRERLHKAGIVASVGLLVILLEQQEALAIPLDFSERIAIAARQGHTLQPLPSPLHRFTQFLRPPVMAAILVGIGIGGGMAWQRPALLEHSQVSTLRLNKLAELVEGDWEGTATYQDGRVTPVRVVFTPASDGLRLTYRYVYPKPRDPESGWWTVEQRTGRLVVDGRDVFQIRQDGARLLLEGWERSNTGSEVVWRFARQQWKREGKSLSITFAAGRPPKRQQTIVLRKK